MNNLYLILILDFIISYVITYEYYVTYPEKISINKAVSSKMPDDSATIFLNVLKENSIFQAFVFDIFSTL